MKHFKMFVTTGMVLALPLLSGAVMAKEICPKPWICEELGLSIPYGKGTKTSEKIRAGYFPEKGTFKGNIIYFEGLGDSMVNHHPLFNTLSKEGYRIIAFDYMGQGGSTGKMNRTRIEIIPEMGKVVWKKFAKNLKKFPKKTMIGWSTGGLAAYMSASKKEADQVILLAPGIVPNYIVGAGLWNCLPNEITMESLTSAAPYRADENDPHLDPIRPNSPLKVPEFAFDLISTAKKAQKTKMPSSVRGFVLLSGDRDTYVDAEKTKDVLGKVAPHFKTIQYPGTLHEIDNERADTQKRVFQDILTFLKKGE